MPRFLTTATQERYLTRLAWQLRENLKNDEPGAVAQLERLTTTMKLLCTISDDAHMVSKKR